MGEYIKENMNLFSSDIPSALWRGFKTGYDMSNRLLDIMIPKKPSGIYGTANFMSEQDKSNFLYSGHYGLTIDGGYGRITQDQSFAHVALIAPSGAGKTTKFILPNLYNLQNCSMVVTDPNGEIFANTAGAKYQEGFNIKVIDVTNPQYSFHYNPLYRAGSTDTATKMISNILVDSAFPNSKGEQNFWNTGGKTIINIFIKCLRNYPNGSFFNLHNVKHLLDHYGTDGQALIPFISRYADALTYQQFQSFSCQDDRVRLGMISTGNIALDAFSDPALCQLTAQENLGFEELRSTPTIIYLIVPEHQIRYYGFFLKIFYSQLFDFCMEMENPGQPYLPIYFLLDEFGNMPIQDFASKITTLRKRKVSCSIVLQDIEMLTSAYGKSDASVILNGGCSSRIFYPGLSYDMCFEIEKILGKTTVIYKDPTKSQPLDLFDNANSREVPRSLLTADEIRTMQDYEAIYLYSNRDPVMLRTTAFYENSAMIAKSQIPMPDLYFPELAPVEYINLGD